MTTRRRFLGTFVGLSGMSAVPLVASSIEPLREPRPSRFDCEEMAPYGCDVSWCTVREALEKLRWDPDTRPAPLLVVHPVNYAIALEIQAGYHGAIDVWATRGVGDETPCDRDRWFISWRGRRVGSAGA